MNHGSYTHTHRSLVNIVMRKPGENFFFFNCWEVGSRAWEFWVSSIHFLVVVCSEHWSTTLLQLEMGRSPLTERS